jgi:DUF1707 SHOCT-like domain
MAGLGEVEGGGIRASDPDHTRVVEQLRAHCTAGRISVEELERRLGRAMSAQTVDELSELLHDLPRLVLPVEPSTHAVLGCGSLASTRAVSQDGSVCGRGWRVWGQRSAAVG